MSLSAQTTAVCVFVPSMRRVVTDETNVEMVFLTHLLAIFTGIIALDV
jgi:hypothetical protein